MGPETLRQLQEAAATTTLPPPGGSYLSKAAPSSWTYPAAQTWPVKGGEAAQGTSGVVQAIKQGKGSIGYADESQVGDLGKPKVKVGSAFVEPSAETRQRQRSSPPRHPTDRPATWPWTWRATRPRPARTRSS